MLAQLGVYGNRRRWQRANLFRFLFASIAHFGLEAHLEVLHDSADADGCVFVIGGGSLFLIRNVLPEAKPPMVSLPGRLL